MKEANLVIKMFSRSSLSSDSDESSTVETYQPPHDLTNRPSCVTGDFVGLPIFVLDEYIEKPLVYENELQPNIKTHFAWTIINTIFCCFSGFIGVFCVFPAMFFSYKTKSEINTSNYNKAFKYSKYAKILNTLATVVILIGMALFFIFAFFKYFK